MAKTICAADGCVKAAHAKGFCNSHLHRFQRYGDPLGGKEYRTRQTGICVIAACGRVRWARGWCQMHYLRWYRHGSAEVTKRRPTGAGSRHLDGSGYMRVGDYGQPRRPEHRVVMEATLGRPLMEFEHVHHKNGLREDNRPENLELWAAPSVTRGVSARQPKGQRVADLLQFIADHYPREMAAILRARRLITMKPPTEQPSLWPDEGDKS
jgi:hypothetical protein